MDRRNLPTRSRRSLLWAVVFFVVFQLAFNVIVDGWFPELYDPEYGVRLAVLRQRIAEEPGRPLLLLIGSSRTVMSFRPEILPPLKTPSGQEVLAFNFSHLGAGPAMHLVELRRLLRQGIRPEWLVVEVMPFCLADDRQTILTATATAHDISATRRYLNPGLVYFHYGRARLVPWYKHRLPLLRRWAPHWLSADARKDQITLDRLGGDCSWWVESQITADEIRRRTAHARAGYQPPLENFHIAPISARSMHDLLDLCRREKIKVSLVLTPEGSEFRSWYSADALAQIDRFCSELSRQYTAPLIDARRWLPDADFTDSHHVLRRGAVTFTTRLRHEVLQPMISP